MNNGTREVKVIKPTLGANAERKLRVAAYCRVSTDSSDQINSFIAQMRYYSDYIRNHESMVFVDIYADEGITGMKSGTFAFRYTILGYRRGENGEPEIIPEEAEVVRKIFNMYLEGASLDQIKSYLETNGIKTKKGKSVWSKQIIQDMLCNERFAGDMLLQKMYIENCINKKVKKNRGEMA